MTHLLELNEIPVLEGEAVNLRDPIDVLNAFAKKLVSRGYDVSNSQELGTGKNGTVYSLGNKNKVLKITIDEVEARAANHLKGKKLQHVIPIHDVFSFPSKQGQEWYGVILSQADELSNQEKMYFDMHVKLIVSNINLDSADEQVNNPWLLSWNKIKQRVLKNTKPDPQEYQDAKEAIAFLEDDSIQFDKLLKELISHKIEYNDVHSNNFMRYKNRFVLVDLGGDGRSPGAEPNMLENKK